MKKSIYLLILISFFLTNFSVFSFVYSIPSKKNKIIGKLINTVVPKNNQLPLEFFAEKYQIGLNNLIESNPNIDLYLPKSGEKLIIPNQLILPNTPHKGIIINSAEMRLYYYPKNTNNVIILPIGIGQVNSQTPKNWITKVIKKRKNPYWIPTNKIRKEYNLKGINLPKIIPSGNSNPMGLYSIYVENMYAIHGTNAHFGIGLRISHGCVRLRNKDIKWLFNNVPIGTRVQFINQPIKVMIKNNHSIYLEVHSYFPYYEKQFNKNLTSINLDPYITKIIENKFVDKTKLNVVLQQHKGIPTKINKLFKQN